MALSLVGYISGVATSSATINVTLPGGTVAGDLCVVTSPAQTGNTSTPAGFTDIDMIVGTTSTDGRSSFKVLDATDISNNYVTMPGDPAFNGKPYQIWILHSTGGSPTINAHSIRWADDGATTPPGDTVDSGTVTTTVDGCIILVTLTAYQTGTAWTSTPGGVSLDQNAPATGVHGVYAYHYTQSTAGLTSNQTAILDVSGGFGREMGFVIAVADAASTEAALNPRLVLPPGQMAPSTMRPPTFDSPPPVNANAPATDAVVTVAANNATCLVKPVAQQATATATANNGTTTAGGPGTLTYVGYATVVASTSATVNMTLPGGSAAGDLCVVALGGGAGNTTTPAGFTLDSGPTATDSGEVRAVHKTLVAGDITNGYVTMPGDPAFNGIEYSGWFFHLTTGTPTVDQVLTRIAGAQGDLTDPTVYDSGTVTTSAANEWLCVLFIGRPGTGTLVWSNTPAGVTIDKNAPNNFNHTLAYHYQQATAGLTANQTATINAPYDREHAVVFAIGGGAGTASPVDTADVAVTGYDARIGGVARATSADVGVLANNSSSSTGQSGYPDATNTGVPAGTTLTTVNIGTALWRTSTDGALLPHTTQVIGGNTYLVYDAYSFQATSGIMYWDSPYLKFTRCEFVWTGQVNNTSGCVQTSSQVLASIVEDCYADGGAAWHNRNFSVQYGDFTMRRCHTQRFGNASVEKNSGGGNAGSILIEDSYLHEPKGWYLPDHIDAIQTDGGIQDITVRHCTVWVDPFGYADGDPNNPPGNGSTSCINITTQLGHLLGNVLVENTQMAGGGAVIYVSYNGNGGVWNFQGTVTVRNNRFDRTHFPSLQGPAYSPPTGHAAIYFTLYPNSVPAQMSWTGNTWENGATLSQAEAMGVGVFTSALATTATANVVANQPTLLLSSKPNASQAVVAVAANNATVTIGGGSVQAAAQQAAVTVAAQAPGKTVAAKGATQAAATVAANNGTTTTLVVGTANAQAAAVTAVANNPTATVAGKTNALATTAVVTVVANNMTASHNAQPSATAAAVTVVGQNATIRIVRGDDKTWPVQWWTPKTWINDIGVRDLNRYLRDNVKAMRQKQMMDVAAVYTATGGTPYTQGAPFNSTSMANVTGALRSDILVPNLWGAPHERMVMHLFGVVSILADATSVVPSSFQMNFVDNSGLSFTSGSYKNQNYYYRPPSGTAMQIPFIATLDGPVTYGYQLQMSVASGGIYQISVFASVIFAPKSFAATTPLTNIQLDDAVLGRLDFGALA